MVIKNCGNRAHLNCLVPCRFGFLIMLQLLERTEPFVLVCKREVNCLEMKACSDREYMIYSFHWIYTLISIHIQTSTTSKSCKFFTQSQSNISSDGDGVILTLEFGLMQDKQNYEKKEFDKHNKDKWLSSSEVKNRDHGLCADIYM